VRISGGSVSSYFNYIDLRVFHKVLDAARERVVNRPAAGRVVAIPFRKHAVLLDHVRGTSDPVPLTMQQCKVALLLFLLAKFLQSKARVPLGTSVLFNAFVFVLSLARFNWETDFPESDQTPVFCLQK